MGRAARNLNGRAILYADVYTDSMKRAIDETNRRRAIQDDFNKKHNITPKTVQRAILDLRGSVYEADYVEVPLKAAEKLEKKYKVDRLDDIPKLIGDLRKKMLHHADLMEFEKAAELRDKIKELEEYELEVR